MPPLDCFPPVKQAVLSQREICRTIPYIGQMGLLLCCVSVALADVRGPTGTLDKRIDGCQLRVNFLWRHKYHLMAIIIGLFQ